MEEVGDESGEQHGNSDAEKRENDLMLAHRQPACPATEFDSKCDRLLTGRLPRGGSVAAQFAALSVTI